jgi:3-phenylpropionate/trans-cinnamate dioxygenase ferredoxin reductase subunit
MSASSVVVIGSGQAGGQAAVSLREQGHRGAVTVIGDEGVLPYERPPLSKSYLAGEPGLDQVLTRAESFYADHDLELVLDDPAASVHRAGHSVVLGSGRTVPYDHLILATGSRPRPMPGALTLRTVADADRLRERLREHARIVVIGAGFIGLEFAAAARQLGHEVALPRAMARVVSPAAAAHLVAEHESRGVAIRLSETVSEIADGEVRLDGGDVLKADLVVAGIGVLPNVELAGAAGLEVHNGVVVDERLRTGDPAIFAIGDCASFPSRHTGAHLRLESVQNATDQGTHVAAAILGSTEPYARLPWFWSDQYDVKLQIAGLVDGHDHTVVTGDSGRFSVYCFRGDTLLGVESVNKPADHLKARRLLSADAQLTPAVVAAPDFDLRAHA